MGVGEWFKDFCGNLRLSPEKRSSLAMRTCRITRAINREFRALDSDSAHRFYVGSMGRGTAIPSVSDVDLLCVLPADTFIRFSGYSGNKQSSLLAAVRTAIRTTYKTSDVFGDGQVVVIAFEDGVTYEVLPAFLNPNGSFVYPNSNDGGKWLNCSPAAELEAFKVMNNLTNGNLVELARMVRAWRDSNSVPMNGMLIDALAYQFIRTWEHREKSYLYYDYMTRDFFNFLANQVTSQNHWLAPGSGSYVWRKGPFEYKARQAEMRALAAIEHTQASRDWSAKLKFREIYGNTFPS